MYVKLVWLTLQKCSVLIADVLCVLFVCLSDPAVHAEDNKAWHCTY